MINGNIYYIDGKSNYSNKLYAIMNMKTGKLETKLTNPSRKFWEVKGHCKNALKNYSEKYNHNPRKYEKLFRLPNPDDLKIVEFKLLLNGFLEEE